MNQEFEIVGIRETVQTVPQIKKKRKEIPFLSITLLSIIVLGCLFCNLIMTKDPTYLDLKNYSTAPNREFWFGIFFR